jgi:hypothetical protein
VLRLEQLVTYGVSRPTALRFESAACSPANVASDADGRERRKRECPFRDGGDVSDRMENPSAFELQSFGESALVGQPVERWVPPQRPLVHAVAFHHGQKSQSLDFVWERPASRRRPASCSPEQGNAPLYRARVRLETPLVGNGWPLATRQARGASGPGRRTLGSSANLIVCRTGAGKGCRRAPRTSLSFRVVNLNRTTDARSETVVSNSDEEVGVAEPAVRGRKQAWVGRPSRTEHAIASSVPVSGSERRGCSFSSSESTSSPILSQRLSRNASSWRIPQLEEELGVQAVFEVLGGAISPAVCEQVRDRCGIRNTRKSFRTRLGESRRLPVEPSHSWFVSGGCTQILDHCVVIAPQRVSFRDVVKRHPGRDSPRLYTQPRRRLRLV